MSEVDKKLARVKYGECERKIRHLSKHIALEEAAKAGSYDDVWAYRCRFCNGWHLGHPKMRNMTPEEIQVAETLRDRRTPRERSSESPFVVLKQLLPKGAAK